MRCDFEKVITMNTSRKLMCIMILLAAAISSLGYVTIEFPGWAELTRMSPYVVIVRCKVSPEPTRLINGITTDNPFRGGRMGGITLSDIEMVSNLKGVGADQRALTLWSEYRPCQGDQYLLFATELRGTNLFALDYYRVVPLGHSFDTNLLAGKDLNDQVKLMLQYRLNNLNQELKKDQEEKKRLEDAAKTWNERQ